MNTKQKKTNCLIIRQLALKVVELAGFEPASGQSATAPSTCLVFDWFFEYGLVQKQTHPDLIPLISPFGRDIPLGNPALFLMRGGLCSRHQGKRGGR